MKDIEKLKEKKKKNLTLYDTGPFWSYFWGADNIKIKIYCVISGMEGDQTCHL